MNTFSNMWKNFKSSKRSIYSLYIFLTLFIISLFSEIISNDKPIIIFSNGKPTRTFCYISDAICGYLKALCSGLNLEFNIGFDTEETSVSDLATCFKNLGIDLVNYSHGIEYKVSDDKDYLNDNPQRRCPNILRAREKLGYNPKISINDGVRKYLTYLLERN